MASFVPDAFKNPSANVASGHYRYMKDEEIFVDTFFSYWSATARDPFAEKKEKKKLPPASLEIPQISFPLKIMLPPVPGTSSSFWQPFIPMSAAPLEADMVTLVAENLEKYLLLKEEKETLSLSQKIKAMVRPQDSIFMKDGKKFKGNIIAENNQEIVLSCSENKAIQNLVFPLSRILKIERKMNLEEAYIFLWKGLDSRDSKGFLELAQSAEENNLPEISQDFFQKFLQAFPSLSEGYLAYASFLRKRLDLDQAYHVYCLAQKNGISQESIIVGMAEIAFSLGLKEKALRLLLPLREFSSLIKAVEFAFALKEETTVENILAKIRSLPLNVEQKKILLYWDALLALYKGNIEKSLSFCEEAAEGISPELSAIQGNALYLQGKPKDACLSLKKAIEKRNVYALYNLSLVYFMGEAYIQATGILKKLLDTPEIQEDPSTVKATIAYISFISNPEENYAQALQLLKEAQINNPENPLPFYLAGEIHKGKKESQEIACQNYQKALALDFQLTPALLSLGILSIQNSNLSDAIRYFQEALFRPLPSSLRADVHAYLSIVYAENEEFLQAQEHIDKAFKIQENHILALQLSAWIANKKGAISEALSHLDHLLAKNPKDEYALKAKEEITENEGLFLWEEQFQREDGEKIRRQWQEIEQDGIDIALREEKAVFSGTNIRGNVSAFLLRSHDFQTFVSIKADLFSKEASAASTGILYGNTEGDCLYFGKNAQNQIVYGKSKQGALPKWQNILDKDQPVLYPETGMANFQIQRTRKEKNTYSLLMDGKLLAKIVWEKEKPGKKDIGFFGFSESHLPWKLEIDNVQIIEKQ